MNINKKQANTLWNEALRYLDMRTDMEKVKLHFAGKANPKLKRMPQIFKNMLQSLTNKQGMNNSIGDISKFKILLFKFSPEKTKDAYDNNWKKLFHRIKLELKPSSRMLISNPKNYWVHFCKGTLDGANYLSQFRSGNDFVLFIDKFASDSSTAVAMPLILSLEIHGLGFPLACDFLMESGWNQYVKPDTHTKNILKGIGISDGKDYDVYKTMITIANHINQEPYTVDKIFWLIGSGKLYLVDETFKTDKWAFIKHVKPLMI